MCFSKAINEKALNKLINDLNLEKLSEQCFTYNMFELTKNIAEIPKEKFDSIFYNNVVCLHIHIITSLLYALLKKKVGYNTDLVKPAELQKARRGTMDLLQKLKVLPNETDTENPEINAIGRKIFLINMGLHTGRQLEISISAKEKTTYRSYFQKNIDSYFGKENVQLYY